MPDIQAVLFDFGGTLRISMPHEDARIPAGITRIQQMLNETGDLQDFYQLLYDRFAAYQSWSIETLIELDETSLWTQWILPDRPLEEIRPLAHELHTLWRDSYAIRKFVPEAADVITCLFRRGYQLGLVSNTTSSTEIHRILAEQSLSGYFDAVILSCKYGRRKPDPAILLTAVEQMGVAPEHCAYIGDRPDRDIATSRKAGFGKSVLIQHPQLSPKPIQGPDQYPDTTITNLTQLLDIFPERPQPAPLTWTKGSEPISGKPSGAWRGSLSTMWTVHNFRTLEDGFRAAMRLGFSHIELNHQVNSAMLAGIDLSQYPISSIHEPCPADISMEELKKRDWLISALDEESRAKGVNAVKRSIDLACSLGVKVIVVHSGCVGDLTAGERELYALHAAGQSQSLEFFELRDRVKEARLALAGPRLASVKRSLVELLDYASTRGVCLGLENRYHVADIPNPDEMGELLELAGPQELGFVYDSGHGYALEALGFYSHLEWLDRFHQRLVGVHLHDIQGISDHNAPGLGEVDFIELASYLPENAFRTCELRTGTTPLQVVAGMEYLVEKGCVLWQSKRHPI